MNRRILGGLAYHAGALVAMAIHVVPIGVMYLLALALTSQREPGGQGEVLLKLAFACTWAVLLGLGVYLWYRRSWFVVVVPVAAALVGYGLFWVGRVTLEWTLLVGH